MGSSRMPWKRQESCIWTQCFTKNVIRYGLDQVMFHSSTMRKSRYERPSPQLTSPVSTVTDLSPHFRFEKQIKTVQTWCFCTKKKNDWSWGLLMENLKYWLLIGRANLILTNGLSFTVCSQPFWINSLEKKPKKDDFLSNYLAIVCGTTVETKSNWANVLIGDKNRLGFVPCLPQQTDNFPLFSPFFFENW